MGKSWDSMKWDWLAAIENGNQLDVVVLIDMFIC
jgi:hypothetical protein